MSTRRVLVTVSAAQLAVGVAGQVLALRRRLPYDIAFVQWRGRPERVARDSLLLGTALSAPVGMLAAQAAGYLVERTGRRALTPRGLDPAATPLVVAGTGLAAAMAYLGPAAAVDT